MLSTAFPKLGTTRDRAATVGERFPLLPHLQLMRPANMATAMADVLAGFAVAGLAGAEKLPWLLLATLALYGGGVTLNDYFDRRLDMVERPERPIPSGRVTAMGAASLGFLLLIFGIGCAFEASQTSGLIATAIAALAFAYDAGGKHIPWIGPLLMGSCRGFNLLLGVTANLAVLHDRWTIGAISLLYIAGITLLSSGEVHGGSRAKSIVSAALVLAAAGLLVRMAGDRILWPAIVLALLAWRVAPALYRACLEPDAMRIRGAVKAGVMSLVYLDAAIAAAYAGPLVAAGILVLILLVVRLARLFPVT